MKIMIVEDESVVRTGLRKMIQENESWQLIGEATNGKQAVTQIEQLQPDLIISDIRMPELNGIELLQEIHAHYPHILVVLLTGYPDFEYAQSALRYGAFDYILKPSRASEITQVLCKAETEIKKKRSDNQQLQDLEERIDQYRPWISEKIVRGLIYGDEIEKHDLKQSPVLNMCHTVTVITLVQETNTRSAIVDIPIYTQRQVENIFAKEIQSIVIPDGQREYVLVLGYPGSADVSIKKIKRHIKRLLDENEKKHGVRFKAGIGKSLPILSGASRSYDQSKLAVKYVNAKSSILHYEDLLQMNEDIFLIPIELEISLLRAIKKGDKQEAITVFETLCVYLKRMTVNEVTNYVCQLHIQILKTTAFYQSEDRVQIEAPPLPFPSLHAATEWIERQIHVFIERMEQQKTKPVNYIIQRVLRMIHEKYKEELSLKKIAEQIQVNPSYLSDLFSKETGQTFSDYFTIYRMEKAKHLLQGTNYKIYQVADAVGYGDSRHFSQVFKKIVGVTPGQFRNRSESEKLS